MAKTHDLVATQGKVTINTVRYELPVGGAITGSLYVRKSDLSFPYPETMQVVVEV